ncbi:MAG: ABC transporter ATP-binding protein [Eubacteriales bacterium]|nr:ABC transporter ATP-binding protein [Eubacteriales bacterium]
MAEVLLKVEHLSAAYGGIRALDDISLEVREGEIVAVLGANGAGKSTLLKCLSSEQKPVSGTITFQGKPLSAKPYNVVESGMVIVPEGRQIFYKLSVYDNLQVGCCLRKDKEGIKEDLEMVYEMFPRLKERENQYGGLLSGGEQQMLAIARGLMARPKLMMLDEPSLGLAPIIVNQIMDILKQVNSRGTTILLVEQNARKALKLCDRAYLMNVGRVVTEGKGEELLANDRLMEAYLG